MELISAFSHNLYFFSFLCIRMLIRCSLLFKKRLFPKEFFTMPSYNLAETIHNKWLQAFSNKSGDLYIVAIDDYIHAFLQVVAYYQYLKGGFGSLGLSKEKLKLRSTQR